MIQNLFSDQNQEDDSVDKVFNESSAQALFKSRKRASSGTIGLISPSKINLELVGAAKSSSELTQDTQ